MMGHIYSGFPTPFYNQKDLLTEEENDVLINHSIKYKEKFAYQPPDWGANISTTWNNFSLEEDPIYEKLLSEVTRHVNIFAKMLNSNYNYSRSGSWLNFYNEGEGQEYHTHNGEIFSAVYFMQVPTNCTNLRMKDPYNDCNPLKNVSVHTEFTSGNFEIEPLERGLVIFRSYVPHMVLNNTKMDKDRITCAFNFNY